MLKGNKHPFHNRNLKSHHNPVLELPEKGAKFAFYIRTPCQAPSFQSLLFLFCFFIATFLAIFSSFFPFFCYKPLKEELLHGMLSKRYLAFPFSF